MSKEKAGSLLEAKVKRRNWRRSKIQKHKIENYVLVSSTITQTFISGAEVHRRIHDYVLKTLVIGPRYLSKHTIFRCQRGISQGYLIYQIPVNVLQGIKEPTFDEAL